MECGAVVGVSLVSDSPLQDSTSISSSTRGGIAERMRLRLQERKYRGVGVRSSGEVINSAVKHAISNLSGVYDPDTYVMQVVRRAVQAVFSVCARSGMSTSPETVGRYVAGVLATFLNKHNARRVDMPSEVRRTVEKVIANSRHELLLSMLSKSMNGYPLVPMSAQAVQTFSVLSFKKLYGMSVASPPFSFFPYNPKDVKPPKRTVLLYSSALLDVLEHRYFEGLTYRARRETEVSFSVSEEYSEVAQRLTKEVMRNRVTKKWARENKVDDRDESEVEALIAYLLASLSLRASVTTSCPVRSVLYTARVPTWMAVYHRPEDVLSQMATLDSMNIYTCVEEYVVIRKTAVHPLQKIISNFLPSSPPSSLREFPLIGSDPGQRGERGA
jgi:hypothetical protein